MLCEGSTCWHGRCSSKPYTGLHTTSVLLVYPGILAVDEDYGHFGPTEVTNGTRLLLYGDSWDIIEGNGKAGFTLDFTNESIKKIQEQLNPGMTYFLGDSSNTWELAISKDRVHKKGLPLNTDNAHRSCYPSMLTINIDVEPRSEEKPDVWIELLIDRHPSKCDMAPLYIVIIFLSILGILIGPIYLLNKRCSFVLEEYHPARLGYELDMWKDESDAPSLASVELSQNFGSFKDFVYGYFLGAIPLVGLAVSYFLPDSKKTSYRIGTLFGTISVFAAAATSWPAVVRGLPIYLRNVGLTFELSMWIVCSCFVVYTTYYWKSTFRPLAIQLISTTAVETNPPGGLEWGIAGFLLGGVLPITGNVITLFFFPIIGRWGSFLGTAVGCLGWTVSCSILGFYTWPSDSSAIAETLCFTFGGLPVFTFYSMILISWSTFYYYLAYLKAEHDTKDIIEQD